MHYVYILQSKKDSMFYVGRTARLLDRINEHNKGQVESTKDRRPMKFLYAEMSSNIKDAARRELYLKTAWGKRYIKSRLKYELEA
jgi:putative endonuclease